MPHPPGQKPQATKGSPKCGAETYGTSKSVPVPPGVDNAMVATPFDKNDPGKKATPNLGRKPGQY